MRARSVRVMLVVLAGRWWLAVLMVLSGCASTGPDSESGWFGKGRVPQGYYRVKKGDSLGELAQSRHVSTKQLIRWNRLKPPYRLRIGQVIRVSPGRTRGSQVARARGSPRNGGLERRVVPGSLASASAVVWEWPLPGAVIQGFRAGDPARQGLRISCQPGEAVRAAGAGEVAYSGSGLIGYGNLIIVKHNKDYLSAYGFNRRLLVKEGNSIKRGQVLAECGEGPGGIHLLHFEVRRDGATVNPLLYLPPRP
jgi:lipoprotein NlpD